MLKFQIGWRGCHIGATQIGDNVGGVNYTALTQDQRALENIFQFAHIAGPVITRQDLQGLWRQPRYLVFIFTMAF